MILPFLLLCLPIALCSTGDDLMDFPGCPGRHCCSDISRNGGAVNFQLRNCECDSACVDFGDCCEDYPRDDARQRMKNDSARPTMKCVEFETGPENMGAYMVVDCPAGTEPDLRAKCEDNDLVEDPITVFPYGPTYVNHHCALCNGHALDRYNPFYKVRCHPPALGPSYFGQSFEASHGDGWEVVFETKIYACYLYFNFSTVAPHAYIRPIDEGALFTMDNSDEVSRREPKFKLTDLFTLNGSEASRREPKFKLSDLFTLNSSRVGRRNLPPPNFGLRLCRANLETECLPGTSDERVREACSGGYQAVVYGGGGGIIDSYRNPYCAICQGEDLRALVCDPSELDMGRRKEFSFAHLFDVSGEGDVGRRKPVCTKDQKYDPTSNTCRNLVCAIPGYVRRNRKCVKKSSLEE